VPRGARRGGARPRRRRRRGRPAAAAAPRSRARGPRSARAHWPSPSDPPPAPAVLLSFSSPAAGREAYHATSYFLALGIPAALTLGPPVSSAVDLVAGLVVPLHAHIGMRSVIIDYVHEPSTQQVVLAGLAVLTAATAVGLTVFNVADVGLTRGIKELWVTQEQPDHAAGAPAGGAHH